MLLQELGDLRSAFLLVDHAGCQGREPIDEKCPRALRREDSTKVFAIKHEEVMQVAWSNDCSAHVRAKTADVLRQAVHDDISPVLERALAIGSGKGVIDNNANRFLAFVIGF